MTDSEIDNIYKANLPISHFAALRGVYDAGYFDANNANVDPGTGDPSMTASAPTADETITTS